MRFVRGKSPVITTEGTPYAPGKAEIFWESDKPEVAIIACGQLVYQSLVAARELEGKGVNVIVLNNHSVKPLDDTNIVNAAKRCGAVVTVEEHQVMGGMGSAVAELLACKFPVPIEFVGMQDVYGESGKPDELIDKYGMGVKDVVAAVKKVISRK